MPPKQLTEFVYDSEDLLFNPHAIFDQIRQEGEIVWSRTLRRWLVVSRSAAVAALQDRSLRVYDLFHALDRIAHRSGETFRDLIRICQWIPFLHDGPRHERLRALFARILADIQQEYLQCFNASSRGLLEDMLERAQADFAKDYADRLHIEALGEVVGFPREDLRWIAENSSSQGSIDFAASVVEIRDANLRAASLLARIQSLIEQGARTPFMGRLGEHLRSTECGDSPDNRLECLTTLMLLGRDTLSGTLTVGLAEILDMHNGVLDCAKLREPTYSPDEIIRLSSAVQIVNRVATRPTSLAGQNISEGDMLMVFLPAANRDPKEYPCPHTFSAAHGANIAFGASRHLCLGMPLSRSAVAIVLKQLADCGEIRSLPGRELDRSRNTRKFRTLPISLGRHHETR